MIFFVKNTIQYIIFQYGPEPSLIGFKVILEKRFTLEILNIKDTLKALSYLTKLYSTAFNVFFLSMKLIF